MGGFRMFSRPYPFWATQDLKHILQCKKERVGLKRKRLWVKAPFIKNPLLGAPFKGPCFVSLFLPLTMSESET